jgi:hypothetical protein
MADNLPPSSTDVKESGSLNLPESSGPRRPIMGLLYLYLYLFLTSAVDKVPLAVRFLLITVPAIEKLQLLINQTKINLFMLLINYKAVMTYRGKSGKVPLILNLVLNSEL